MALNSEKADNNLIFANSTSANSGVSLVQLKYFPNKAEINRSNAVNSYNLD